MQSVQWKRTADGWDPAATAKAGQGYATSADDGGLLGTGPQPNVERKAMKRITEAKAREISLAKDLSGYPREELQLTDEWVKRYAMRKLVERTAQFDKPIREFIRLMARCHYGSAETDEFLQTLKCYPEWLS